MNKKAAVQNHINAIAQLVFEYIKENNSMYTGGWVPASRIKTDLGLNFDAVPMNNAKGKKSGWLFGIASRILEEKGSLKYKKKENKAFYKSI